MKATAKSALIGGILGGVAFLASLILCFVFLYRRKKASSSFIPITLPRQKITMSKGLRGTDSRVRGAAEAGHLNGKMCRILPLFRRQAVHNLVVNPIVHSEDYIPLEGKRGTFSS